jgi:hypothetical protein
MIVLPACFGPGFPAYRSIGGLFSPLSFYAKRVSDFRISVFIRIYLGSGHRPSIVSAPSSASHSSIGARIEKRVILFGPSRFGHALPFASRPLRSPRPSRQRLSTIAFFYIRYSWQGEGPNDLFTGRATPLGDKRQTRFARSGATTVRPRIV